MTLRSFSLEIICTEWLGGEREQWRVLDYARSNVRQENNYRMNTHELKRENEMDAKNKCASLFTRKNQSQ